MSAWKAKGDHARTYRDLINAKFVPRTNLKRVDRNGTWYSSVRWKLAGSALGTRTPGTRGSWKGGRGSGRLPERSGADADRRAVLQHRGTQWHRICHDVVERCAFESWAFKELSPEEHLKQCAELEREGFRPMGISAIEVPATPGGPNERAQSRIATASVWRRPLVAEDDKDRLAERKAVAAISLYLLGKPDLLKQHLAQADDPRLRSELIERLAAFEVDIQKLAPYLDGSQPSQASLQRALLLVLASIPNERVPVELRKKLTTRLGELYRDDPDRGVHSAAELVLRNWKLDDVLQHELDELRLKAKPIRQLTAKGLPPWVARSGSSRPAARRWSCSTAHSSS